MTITVLIADDEELVRAGFRVLVNSAPDLDVVGEARTGEEAVALARAEQPDVILMDVQMPVLNGIEATRNLLAGPTPAQVRVLILTTFDLDEYAFEGLRAGASGFLLKDTPPEELISAIRVLAAGESLLTPRVTRRLIEEYTAGPAATPQPRKLPGITARELEILRLVARGLSNAEIAEQLFLSIGTVKIHVSRLLAKLDARDRTQLVIAAYEAGLGSLT
ncbi:response regulator transcription factor [Kitasatospora sp. GP82]|uniref:response regulator transcription factor n=1 Tax=Kitasatospora sp. GP82 TaxID=3035089 RepID=UPI0024770EAB|nr:response regulator transcription factor [Kitasatospora sp. GP82]MDH6123596.1 DNA-binding NarL/FixJ family response regulator [Kitasatospora sp. GP82]